MSSKVTYLQMEAIGSTLVVLDDYPATVILNPFPYVHQLADLYMFQKYDPKLIMQSHNWYRVQGGFWSGVFDAYPA